MKQQIGNTADFAIRYEFFEDRDTEIELYINNSNNILEFHRYGTTLTTRWNLDDLMLWMRHFIDTMHNDPYPVETEGEYAAIKDENARDFDSTNIEEMRSYYKKLEDWNLRHRWHTECMGAILSDIYFEQKDDFVEISWNNLDQAEEAKFTYEFGGAKVKKSIFCAVWNEFLQVYADHWYPEK